MASKARFRGWEETELGLLRNALACGLPYWNTSYSDVYESQRNPAQAFL
jgi:hypothetical protein